MPNQSSRKAPADTEAGSRRPASYSIGAGALDLAIGRRSCSGPIYRPARLASLEMVLMAWFILFVAGLFEVVWAYAMKQSEGFTRLTPSIVTGVAMLISCALLAWSMRTLPLGTAYTVWTGVGAVGAFIVGVIVLNEPAGAGRIAAAFLIVSGLILMRISSPT